MDRKDGQPRRRWVLTDEQRASRAARCRVMAEARAGKPLQAEHRQKISSAVSKFWSGKARPIGQETRLRISKALKGRFHTDSLEARLMANRGVTEKGCWEWRGGRTEGGYGEIAYRGRPRYVHVLAGRLWGIRGTGPFTLHECDNPSCFNPEHLYRGTPKNNVDDMVRRGRAPWQQGPADAA